MGRFEEMMSNGFKRNVASSLLNVLELQERGASEEDAVRLNETANDVFKEILALLGRTADETPGEGKQLQTLMYLVEFVGRTMQQSIEVALTQQLLEMQMAFGIEIIPTYGDDPENCPCSICTANREIRKRQSQETKH